MGAVLGVLASALAWFRFYRALAADALAHAHATAPEPKRRRTLASSLLDGALSAALVGTAVGLTVYRLWRERGQPPPDTAEHALPPPPPYHEGDWPAQAHLRSAASMPAMRVIPATPKRKARRAAGTAVGSARHRKTPSRAPLGALFASPTKPPARAAPAPEFDFGPAPPVLDPYAAPESDYHDALEDAMEQDTDADEADAEAGLAALNGRLAALIADGQRALGAAVVVAAEDAADAVDDGLGAWADEDDAPRAAVSRTGSLRRRRVRSLVGLSPRKAPLSPPAPLTPVRSRRGESADSVRSSREDATDWESPELRELMHRARLARGL